MKTYLALAFLALMIVGCASGVTRNQQGSSAVPTSAAIKVSKDNPITSVSLSLSDDAKIKLEDNSGFSQEMLLEQIKAALIKNELLSNKSQNLSLDVVVTDMRIRSTFSAMTFGFLAGNDSITGDAQIKDKKGAEVDRFGVSTSYALGGLIGGIGTVRTGWLYDSFSNEIVKEITGTQPVAQDQ